MRKEVSLIAVLLIVSFLFINIISAQPPFETQSFPEGLDIILNQQNILAIGTNYTLRVHVYNHSTGEKIDNTSTSCDLHWNKPNGEQALFTSLGYNLTTNEFYIFISEGNFTLGGLYPWIIECQFDDGGIVFGGFVEGLLELNPVGEELTEGKSIMYILLTVSVFIIFLLALYFQIILDYKDTVNSKGETIFIPKQKYLKIGMTLITFPLFLTFLNLLIGLSNLVGLTIFSGIIGGLFTFLVYLSWPIFVGIGVWLMYVLLRDWKPHRILNEFGRVGL